MLIFVCQVLDSEDSVQTSITCQVVQPPVEVSPCVEDALLRASKDSAGRVCGTEGAWLKFGGLKGSLVYVHEVCSRPYVKIHPQHYVVPCKIVRVDTHYSLHLPGHVI